jgi:hypothetical protein
MHLIADYIHPYQSEVGMPSQCRLRIYSPNDQEDMPVVICSEIHNNPGVPVTDAAKRIAAEVMRYHKLDRPIWIEHYPPEATNGIEDTFELVVFDSYEVRKVLIDRTKPHYEIGSPAWKPLDRATVEVLIGQRV